MYIEMTKWCSCSLALHSGSTQRRTMRNNFHFKCYNAPRSDTPTCHPHHALIQMGECTISANVVVTNAMGEVQTPAASLPSTTQTRHVPESPECATHGTVHSNKTRANNAEVSTHVPTNSPQLGCAHRSPMHHGAMRYTGRATPPGRMLPS